MSLQTETPLVSIVIPIYNEEGILHASVIDLIDRLRELEERQHRKIPYEILLSENGSTDRTVEIAEEIAGRHPEVHIHSLGEPNYGKALRLGIKRARGTFVICDEIDLCDTDFYERALQLLEPARAELVIGSKVMAGAEDKRPMMRHMATLVINSMLRVLVGFHGTDTHGLKAFRRVALLPIVDECVVDRDLFASEFVIRAERGGKQVQEIPIHIVEKRPPSVNLFRRVPKVLKDITRLTYIIRFNG